MTNNYNEIARIYDALSRVVFGHAIINAQLYLISFIGNENKVLIAGGGTGWILEKISKLNKEDILVVYVEKSAAMITLAKKRNFRNIEVQFINMAAEDYDTTEKFDVVITPFFFDNFKEEKIEHMFSKLSNNLKQNGLWLYADFINDKSNKKLWQQFLLKVMYLFFRITAKIETQKLIDMRQYFARKYAEISRKLFYKNFIQAVAYKKISN